MVSEAEAALTGEDSLLFADALDQWLADSPQAESDVVRSVKILRTFVRMSGFEDALPRRLLGQGMRGLGFKMFACEMALAPLLASPSLLTVHGLEQYGDVWAREGYQAIALRTWKLCEKLGPLPDSLRNKVWDLESRLPS